MIIKGIILKQRMNKDLFDIMEITKNALNGKLDNESQRYLDRSILERRLDGMLNIFNVFCKKYFILNFNQNLRTSFGRINKNQSQRTQGKDIKAGS